MTPPKGGRRKTTGDDPTPKRQHQDATLRTPDHLSNDATSDDTTEVSATTNTTPADSSTADSTVQSSTTHNLPPLAVWCRPSQADLVAEIAKLAGLRIMLAGSPDLGRSAAVADLLALAHPHASPIDDVRTLISRAEPGGLVLLASLDRFGTDGDRADLRLLSSAAERGVRVLTFEPIPSSVAHLPSTDITRRGSASRSRTDQPTSADVFPARRTPDWWSAVGHDTLDLVSHVGSPCALAVQAIASQDHGSLSARLLDVCSLIVGLLGQPEQVDAALAPATAGASLHLAADTLGPELSGTITLNARYADGRAAAAIASNTADTWRRHATLLTSAGTILIDDHNATAASEQPAQPTSLTISDPAQTTQTQTTHAVLFASLVASQIGQIITRNEVASREHADQHAPHDRAALALAEAALLSTRTSEPESPATIERLAGAVIGV